MKRQMSDAAAVALAVVTAAGAVCARPVPRWPGVLLVVAAFVLRRPLVLAAGSGILACALAARAWAGLAPPDIAVVRATVTLVSDPVTTTGGGVRVDVRLGRQRLQAWAPPGRAARVLAVRLAGERVALQGVVQPLDPTRRAWLASRHVSGRLEVTAVQGWAPGSRLAQGANGLRRLLVRGAVSLAPPRRALFTGLVIGDDRGQDRQTAAAFRDAGLSHLLVVSGGNVAFVLALAGPVLRRLPLGGRLLGALGLLGGFGVLTRWEPSVLRAEAMAAAALVAAWRGRPQPAIRLLAVAVWLLVLVDPLLVHSISFRLSVGASAGIALLAGPLAARLPGPRFLAEVVAVTAAAQAGVAPVLVPAFGPVPLATLPANALAVPAAGLVMTWGMTGGILAGLVGGRLASVLHLPTAALVGWVECVARLAAAAPLPRLGLRAVGCLTAAVAAVAKLAGVRDRGPPRGV